VVTFAIEDKDENCNYNAEQYVNPAKLAQSPKNLTCDSLQVCTETSKPMTSNIQSHTKILKSVRPSLLVMAKVKA
jgi:hypothetical protein